VNAPRIAPGNRGEVGAFGWAFSGVAGLVSGTTPPNVFLTMGRHRRLFRGWLRFAGRLMPGGRLPRRETELVILRVAHLTGCRYEFDHHVHLGRRAGVTSGDVERVVEGPDAQGWSPREAAILSAVDQLHETGDLDDERWGRLHRFLGERDLIELVLLVGHYEMLATFIRTMRIQPDTPRRGRLDPRTLG